MYETYMTRPARLLSGVSLQRSTLWMTMLVPATIWMICSEVMAWRVAWLKRTPRAQAA